MRPGSTNNGPQLLYKGAAGGPQGSTIINVAFPVLIGPALKSTEAKFTGVEVRAPRTTFASTATSPPSPATAGPSSAPPQSSRAELEPSKPNSSPASPCSKPSQPRRVPTATRPLALLGRPFAITDPTPRAKAAALEERKATAAAATKRPPSPGTAEGEKACAAKARAFRGSMPKEHCAHGITGCGAATGDGAFVEDFPPKKQAELPGDVATGIAGQTAPIRARQRWSTTSSRAAWTPS